jgi:hypothetical protein
MKTNTQQTTNTSVLQPPFGTELVMSPNEGSQRSFVGNDAAFCFPYNVRFGFLCLLLRCGARSPHRCRRLVLHSLLRALCIHRSSLGRRWRWCRRWLRCLRLLLLCRRRLLRLGWCLLGLVRLLFRPLCPTLIVLLNKSTSEDEPEKNNPRWSNR